LKVWPIQIQGEKDGKTAIGRGDRYAEVPEPETPRPSVASKRTTRERKDQRRMVFVSAAIEDQTAEVNARQSKPKGGELKTKYI